MVCDFLNVKLQVIWNHIYKCVYCSTTMLLVKTVAASTRKWKRTFLLMNHEKMFISCQLVFLGIDDHFLSWICCSHFYKYRNFPFSQSISHDLVLLCQLFDRHIRSHRLVFQGIWNVFCFSVLGVDCLIARISVVAPNSPWPLTGRLSSVSWPPTLWKYRIVLELVDDRPFIVPADCHCVWWQLRGGFLCSQCIQAAGLWRFSRIC